MTITPDLPERRYLDYQTRVCAARTPAELDSVAELIRDARGAERITKDRYLALAAAAGKRRTSLAARLLPIGAGSSPYACTFCQGPMVRNVGPLDEPDTDGVPIVDTRDVCEVCGHQQPVNVDQMDRSEVRRRDQVVRAHNAVIDHSDCGVGSVCRASRPGRPAVPAEAVAR
jgi:hypothetical protein